MEILLVGNGFDLAHNLPTKYTDFLNFVDGIRQANDYIIRRHTGEQFSLCRGNDPYYIQLTTTISLNFICNDLYKEPYNKDLIKCIDDNFWIDYFLAQKNYTKENWIDFEKEISEVVKFLDKSLKSTIDNLEGCFIKEQLLNSQKVDSDNKCIDIIELLVDDLNKLIRALEIYLTKYLPNPSSEITCISEIAQDIDNVISFNYTDTFRKLYLESDKITDDNINFIHGCAKIDNTIENNNMVLGINEYLDSKEQRERVELVEFKKFYQRIFKGTGCNYKDWLSSASRNIVLYIFGHSLDITDCDILRDLLLHPKVYTTIFYKDKKQNCQQIINLIKLIGEPELIERTGHRNATIKFKEQY